MSRATLKTRQHSRLTRILLREDFVPSKGPLAVDAEKGIIERVKVCGFDSINGRKYLPEALKAAIPLYEGAKVFLDHPSGQPDAPRNDDDGFGKIFNVRFEDDGLYADLHYFKSHPMAARVCEDVQRGIGFFGMSHNAQGEGERDTEGTFIVSRIVEVRSVDLVSEAATVSNLWESNQRRAKPMKIKAYLEAVLPKLSAKQQKSLKPLLEEDGMDDMGDMPAEAPAASDDWRASLAAVVGQLAASDDAEAHDLAGKIMKLLKPDAPEMEAEGDDEEKDMEEAEGDDEEEKKDVEESGSNEIRGKNQDAQKRAMWAKDPDGHEAKRHKPISGMAQLKEQVAKQGKELAALRAEKESATLREWVRSETDKRRLPCDADLLESLCGMSDRGAITKHLDYLKRIGLTASRTLPRSQAAGVPVVEHRVKLETPKDIAAFLTSNCN